MKFTFSFSEILGYLFGFISIGITVVYSIKADLERNAIRAIIQSEYNSHYSIARACSRAREIFDQTSEESRSLDTCNQLIRKLEIIRGISDSSRLRLISYGKYFFPKDKIPKYEHPAFPDIEQPDEIKLGLTPDESIKK